MWECKMAASRTVWGAIVAELTYKQLKACTEPCNPFFSPAREWLARKQVLPHSYQRARKVNTVEPASKKLYTYTVSAQGLPTPHSLWCQTVGAGWESTQLVQPLISLNGNGWHLMLTGSDPGQVFASGLTFHQRWLRQGQIMTTKQIQ